jgi:hypothetical protein
MVRGLIAPPTSPVCRPRPADWTEHVAAHDDRAHRIHQFVECCNVGLIAAVVPSKQLAAADADRLLQGLVWAGDKAI